MQNYGNMIRLLFTVQVSAFKLMKRGFYHEMFELCFSNSGICKASITAVVYIIYLTNMGTHECDFHCFHLPFYLIRVRENRLW